MKNPNIETDECRFLKGVQKNQLKMRLFKEWSKIGQKVGSCQKRAARDE